MSPIDLPPPINHRAEAQDLIRVVKDHGDMTGYAIAAVAEAVLDLADAVRAAQPVRKGPVQPVARRLPTDECRACGHRRMAHHDGDECRMASCACMAFMAVSGG